MTRPVGLSLSKTVPTDSPVPWAETACMLTVLTFSVEISFEVQPVKSTAPRAQSVVTLKNEDINWHPDHYSVFVHLLNQSNIKRTIYNQYLNVLFCLIADV